jgi:hypothetical protein
MNRAIPRLILAVALALPTTAFAKPAAGASQNGDVWRASADRIPIGSTVTIRTNAGQRITAVLYAVDDTGITFKPRTRIAEAPRRLTYDQIAEVAPREDRVNILKYIAIGAAIGGAVFLALLAGAAE